MELTELLSSRWYDEVDLNTRKTEAILARCAASVAMYKNTPKTGSSIGRELGKDHSTISHYLNVVHPQAMQQKLKGYPVMYLEACKLVREDEEANRSMTLTSLFKRLEQLKNEAKALQQVIDEVTEL